MLESLASAPAPAIDDRQTAGQRICSSSFDLTAADAEAKRKRELDDLFLAELGAPRPKPAAAPATASAGAKKPKVMEFRMPGASVPRPSHVTAKAAPETLTITKTYDYAGETITCAAALLRSLTCASVAQEVGKGSKEARQAAEQQRCAEHWRDRSDVSQAGPGPIAGARCHHGPDGQEEVPRHRGAGAAPNPPLRSPPQTKSSLDWEAFKQQEGIVEELAQHKKDGCG